MFRETSPAGPASALTLTILRKVVGVLGRHFMAPLAVCPEGTPSPRFCRLCGGLSRALDALAARDFSTLATIAVVMAGLWINPQIEVRASEGMPPGAFGHPPPPHVFPLAHDLQVVWPKTRLVLTKMVELEAGFYRPTGQHES